METALPCPFCGLLPYVGPTGDEGNAWGFVTCDNQLCPTWNGSTGVYVSDAEMLADDRGRAAYQAAAIRRWNRRAP